jgi:predicted lysophospholipase L1 biosynthesis ABC-type transport system permease subunit
MEYLVKELPNLGVGVAAIVAIVIMADRFLKALAKKDKDYTGYVESNNHESVKAIVAATEVMRQCAKSIENSSEYMKESTEVMCEVKGVLISRDKNK